MLTLPDVQAISKPYKFQLEFKGSEPLKNKTAQGWKDFWKFKRMICERATECKRPQTENNLPKSLTDS